MKYNSFYKSYIGSLDHDDLYEKVIFWGIFDNFKSLFCFLLRNFLFIKQVLCYRAKPRERRWLYYKNLIL